MSVLSPKPTDLLDGRNCVWVGVRRRLVVCGAGQFPFGAEPIFFGRTMHMAAAGPIRMRQFGNLLVCDAARWYGRGGIQAGDAALTHSRQGFSNGRCAEFVVVAR